MRKEIPILVFSAVLAMAGCSSAAAASSSADSSAQTVTGKVTAIDGSTVTLQIGSLNEGPGNQKPEDNSAKRHQMTKKPLFKGFF